MKHMIKLLVLICFSLPITTQAQPLYYNSQFDLSEMFGEYKDEITKAYGGSSFNNITPFAYFILANTARASQAKRSVRYQEESLIPSRKKIDSLGQNYFLICPVYRTSNKILIGMFPEGVEIAWQKPDGGYVYIITRTCPYDINCKNFLALTYDKQTKTTRGALGAEVLHMLDELSPELGKYASK